VSHDFYWQALELDLRGKREFTIIVYSTLGGMSKQRFQPYKALLKLCDEALEIADRHNLDEGRLYDALQLDDSAHQVELLQQMAQRHLTVKQVKEIVEKGQNNLTNSDDDLPFLPRSAPQMAKLALKPAFEEHDAWLVIEGWLVSDSWVCTPKTYCAFIAQVNLPNMGVNYV
jgi:hypothetical protein